MKELILTFSLLLFSGTLIAQDTTSLGCDCEISKILVNKKLTTLLSSKKGQAGAEEQKMEFLKELQSLKEERTRVYKACEGVSSETDPECIHGKELKSAEQDYELIIRILQMQQMQKQE